jgi:hypothetical protein
MNRSAQVGLELNGNENNTELLVNSCFRVVNVFLVLVTCIGKFGMGLYRLTH